MPDIRDIWISANNIIRTSRRMVNEGLKPLGLSSAEGNILFHLLGQEEAMLQDEIVEQLDISKPAVSRALDGLERKELIWREKDPHDKRANLVLLTPKAQEIGPQVRQVYNQVFASAAELVSEQEMEDIIQLFRRVSEAFSKARIEIKGTEEPD